MIAYWLLFSLPLLGVITPLQLMGRVRTLAWLAVIIFAIFAIGLRYEVGGDWTGLLSVSDYLIGKGVQVGLAYEGPGYGLLNWASAKVGLGIYGVNLVCGAIFVIGLAIFCRRQPIPWLAWLVATPYLLIVVGMGYTRQSVALGLLVWGLVFLDEKKIGRFFILLLIGATFQKTVLLMTPLAILGWKGSWWIRVTGIIVLIGVGFFDYQYRFGIAEYLSSLWTNYVERSTYQSQGASLRVLMNAVPATILLLAWRPWKRRFGDPGFWNWLAVASIASVILVGIPQFSLMPNASTAVDRINLYIAPIQLYFWSRFPLLFRDLVTRTGTILAICIIYFATLWVWLNHASHAYNWVPYKSIFSV